jgi:hypothetical protein
MEIAILTAMEVLPVPPLPLATDTIKPTTLLGFKKYVKDSAYLVVLSFICSVVDVAK